MWNRFLHLAFICRFGRQSLTEMLGRRATCFELRLFQRAIEEILSEEYASKPPEMRHED